VHGHIFCAVAAGTPCADWLMWYDFSSRLITMPQSYPPSPRDELLKQARQLERDIKISIEQFSQRTGLLVVEVQVDNANSLAGGSCCVWVRASLDANP
jgi:hypothetical protein